MADGPSHEIDGVRILPLTSHEDARGAFTELYRKEWLAGTPAMPQVNLSISREGVLRGLHFHREQADYWVLLSGTAFVGMYDLRRGSPSERRKVEIRIAADEERRGLYIPPGVAHGFYAETDLAMLYMVDRYFTGEDEHGIAWNDPDAGIGWHAKDPIISDRDRANPSLAEVLRDPPPYTR